MARIVSGQREPRGVKDFQLSHDFFAGARRDREQSEARAFQQNLQLQQAMIGMQKERQRSQQLLNQQAQMGDARALQELSMQAKKGKLENRVEEGLQLLSGITDEKARVPAMKAMQALFDEEDKEERFQAADGLLQQATESGLFQPEQIQGFTSRLQSKRASNESPDDVMSEMMGVYEQVGLDATNAKENQEAFAQAQALVETLPRGSFERRQAEIALNAVLSDEGALKRQGFGTKTLQAVQRAALGTREQFEQRGLEREERQQATLSPQHVMEGLGGMTSGEMKSEMEKEPTAPTAFGLFGEELGTGGPKIPAGRLPGTHKTKGKIYGGKPKPEAVTQAVQALVEETRDPVELAKRLKEQGFKLTPEVQALARKALQGRRANAQAVQ